MDLWLKVGVNVNLGLQVIIKTIQSYAKRYLWLLLLLNRLLQGKWGTQVQKFKFLLIHEARSGKCSWLSSSLPKNCISIGWSKFGALLVRRQRQMVTLLTYEISIYFFLLIDQKKASAFSALESLGMLFAQKLIIVGNSVRESERARDRARASERASKQASE